MPPLIAIALGDITGIGPEVTLKALARELSADDARYLVIGDQAFLRRLNDSLRLGLTLSRFEEARSDGRLFFHQPDGTVLPPDLPCGDASAARAAVAWLKDGAGRALRGEVAALVTAPVSKKAILDAGFKDFVGQTEFLSELAGARRTVMMLLGPDERGRWLRVALATTHLPLKDVAAALTLDKVEQAIVRASEACRDLGLPRAKVGVCGLNPHAGEGGKLGNEEQTIIGPAVAAARGRGVDVAGPFAADALFHSVIQGHFDAVVAMYHDQGLAPLKMVAFDHGVNWTLGLPFIRTSPDHGTAYDIAGRGLADPSSMIAAIRLAKQVARRRAGQTG
ncbi:MAG: 4-hydroxythreonine-4-phosphate dehydrogenase PdxA [Verrucomicrobia bacterium]|nr:4-hydroxythreonine-4-phosphate dehydrogenase PdxA [Verrucomicrobiota bacterium]